MVGVARSLEPMRRKLTRGVSGRKLESCNQGLVPKRLTGRRRALLIDVLGRSDSDSRTLACLTPMLERLGFEHIESCVGEAATRNVVLSTLRDWVDGAARGDTCLFYYFGHGKRVRFMDRGRPATDEDLVGLELKRGDGVPTLLDVELSIELAKLQTSCGDVGSVVAVIDCCHASAAVRGAGAQIRGSLRARGQVKRGHEVLTPPLDDWAKELLGEIERRANRGLPADGHPGIVRLAAASAWRSAFEIHGGGRLGLMTAALVEAIWQALDQGVDVDEHLCWGMLVHRVRERVVQSNRVEEQWVTLAGPQDRVLFSAKSVKLPRSVGFISTDAQHGYLRSGWLAGVGLGDRWALLEPWLQADGEPSVIGHGTVVAVEVNRAELQLDASLDPAIGQLHACAVMQRSANPMVVRARTTEREPPEQELGLLEAGSPWLASGTPSFGVDGGRMRVYDTEGRALLDVSSQNLLAARERLEDLARRKYLLELLSCFPAREGGDVSWRIWHHPSSGDERRLLESEATIDPGDGVSFELYNDPNRRARHWFIAIIHVDVGGRLTLMHMRQPEGVEIGSGATESVGQRLGGSHRGLCLTWPEGTPHERALPANFVMLACRRPLNLANLVRWQVRDHTEAFQIQRIGDGATRREATRHAASHSHVPELADDWAWRKFDLMLNPPGPRAA